MTELREHWAVDPNTGEKVFKVHKFKTIIKDNGDVFYTDKNGYSFKSEDGVELTVKTFINNKPI